MGHHAYCVGLYSDLAAVGKAIEEFKPHIAVNLLEEFDGKVLFDQNVVSYLELMKLPLYRMQSPRPSRSPATRLLRKKILTYHRIPVPGFAVFPRGQKIVRPKRLGFPLFVKSVTEEGSTGISQAIRGYDDEKLKERVEFIHTKTNSHAIAEQFIEGRELLRRRDGQRTASIFHAVGAADSQTSRRVTEYRNQPAEMERPLPEEGRAGDRGRGPHSGTSQKARNAFPSESNRLLSLSGYARLDYRLTKDGEFYLLEANPNPQIALNEDFADSAKHSKVSYEELLQKIITLGTELRTPPNT